MRPRSLRAKIILGFMACIGVSALAFGILVAVGFQVTEAESASRNAVESNRSAVRLDQRAGSAKAALYRYLYSVDATDRNSLSTELKEIGAATSGGTALAGRADAAAELIQKSQVAAVSLFDLSSSLASPLVTLGELSATLSDPAASAIVARINQANGLLVTDLGRLMALRSDRAGDAVVENTQRMKAALKELQELPVATARLKKVAGVVLRDIETLSAAVDAYRKLTAERNSALNSLKAGFDAVVGELQTRLDTSNTAFAAASTALAGASELMMTSLLGGSLAVLSIGVTLAVVIGRSISRPIVSLTSTMDSIAKADYAAEVPWQSRTDEIGAMARAVAVFKANGLTLIEKDREARESRTHADEERARNDAVRAAAAQEQVFVVSSIGASLTRLAQGDLTCRLDDAFPGDYRQIQSDFNGAMGQLQGTIATVVANAHGIRSGTGEISQAADDLSRRTEQQAATLEETAAALDEITATVHKTADGASYAQGMVGSTKSDADRSGEIVERAVLAMAEIESSSSQITQIIGVIDEIAFQTNLLALNAGIEAARAGDAGRGFAVVASEVRALAQRSAEAAKEIKGLINASTRQVGAGVDLVGKAGEALARISDQVGQINVIVAEIAASAKEQSTGLAEVNKAVNQMDQMTQQNAAMVEQSTAASHAIAQEADELGHLVARFQLDQGAEVTPIALQPALAKPESAKPASFKFRPVASMRTAGGRGASAVRKPEPAGAAAGYEEF